MATQIKFDLTLEPYGYGDVWPDYYIRINGQLQEQGTLKTTTTWHFDTDLEDGSHILSVGLTNKQDADTVCTDNEIVADKAIYIHPIEIEGYKLDDFMHRAVYYPVDRPSLQSNYLGWNGEWTLDFTTPIFTWIHETQNLGWIYGKNI